MEEGGGGGGSCRSFDVGDGGCCVCVIGSSIAVSLRLDLRVAPFVRLFVVSVVLLLFSVSIALPASALPAADFGTLKPALPAEDFGTLKRLLADPSVERIEVKRDIKLTEELPKVTRSIFVSGSCQRTGGQCVIDGDGKFRVFLIMNLRCQVSTTGVDDTWTDLAAEGKRGYQPQIHVDLTNLKLINARSAPTICCDDKSWVNGAAISVCGSSIVTLKSMTFEGNVASPPLPPPPPPPSSSPPPLPGFHTLSPRKSVPSLDDDSPRRLAGAGGALAVHTTIEASLVSIEDCIFRDNRAGSGGAVYVSDKVKCSISSSTFENNKATSGDEGSEGDGGGALLIWSGHVEVRRSRFLRNSHPFGPGGAVHVATEILGMRSDFQSNVFQSNSAQSGGAISVWRAGVSLCQNQFIDNVKLGERSSGRANDRSASANASPPGYGGTYPVTQAASCGGSSASGSLSTAGSGGNGSDNRSSGDGGGSGSGSGSGSANCSGSGNSGSGSSESGKFNGKDNGNRNGGGESEMVNGISDNVLVVLDSQPAKFCPIVPEGTRVVCVRDYTGSMFESDSPCSVKDHVQLGCDSDGGCLPMGVDKRTATGRLVSFLLDEKLDELTLTEHVVLTEGLPIPNLVRNRTKSITIKGDCGLGSPGRRCVIDGQGKFVTFSFFFHPVVMEGVEIRRAALTALRADAGFSGKNLAFRFNKGPIMDGEYISHRMSGSGLRASSQGDVSISDSLFEDNVGFSGSALLLSSSSSSSSSSSAITRYTAYSPYPHSHPVRTPSRRQKSRVVVSRCRFVNNLASGSGAAILIEGRDPVNDEKILVERDSVVSYPDKTPDSQKNKKTTTVTFYRFQDCTFGGNTAGTGAAIAGVYEVGHVAVARCSFKKSKATERYSGGAVHLEMTRQLSVCNCKFSGNVAKDSNSSDMYIGQGLSGSQQTEAIFCPRVPRSVTYNCDRDGRFNEPTPCRRTIQGRDGCRRCKDTLRSTDD